jgi:hypothetical protein
MATFPPNTLLEFIQPTDDHANTNNSSPYPRLLNNVTTEDGQIISAGTPIVEIKNGREAISLYHVPGSIAQREAIRLQESNTSFSISTTPRISPTKSLTTPIHKTSSSSPTYASPTQHHSTTTTTISTDSTGDPIRTILLNQKSLIDTLKHDLLEKNSKLQQLNTESHEKSLEISRLRHVLESNTIHQTSLTKQNIEIQTLSRENELLVTHLKQQIQQSTQREDELNQKLQLLQQNYDKTLLENTRIHENYQSQISILQSEKNNITSLREEDFKQQQILEQELDVVRNRCYQLENELHDLQVEKKQAWTRNVLEMEQMKSHNEQLELQLAESKAIISSLTNSVEAERNMTQLLHSRVQELEENNGELRISLQDMETLSVITHERYEKELHERDVKIISLTEKERESQSMMNQLTSSWEESERNHRITKETMQKSNHHIQILEETISRMKKQVSSLETNVVDVNEKLRVAQDKAIKESERCVLLTKELDEEKKLSRLREKTTNSLVEDFGGGHLVGITSPMKMISASSSPLSSSMNKQQQPLTFSENNIVHRKQQQQLPRSSTSNISELVNAKKLTFGGMMGLSSPAAAPAPAPAAVTDNNNNNSINNGV